MVTKAQPALAGNGTGHWWPSKYGHGIVVVENLRLAEIAQAQEHEFLLVISHAKLRGAAGAWVAPLAIV